MDAFPPAATRQGTARQRAASPIEELAQQFAAEQGVSAPPGEHEEDALAAIWDALSRRGITNPGLSFARWATATLLGGVFPTILANTPNVAALFERLQRFHPIFGRYQIILTPDRRVTSLSLEAAGGGPAHPDSVDAFFAIVCWLSRRLTNDVTTAKQVTLRRSTPTDVDSYRELLGDVRFGAERDRCLFQGGLLTPIDRADPAILAALEPYAERRIAEQGRPWAAIVADLVAKEPDSFPTLASVCRSLAVSARTLQLRLADEGTTFSAIVERAQRDRALALLDTSDLPITTIAAAVGFSSPAVLTRAVRRWTGRTPTDYRARH